MTFYGNIFASAYRFYGRFKNEDPYFGSVAYTCTCIIVLIFFIETVVFKIYGITFPKIPTAIIVLGSLSLLILCFLYYSKKRVARVLEKFDKKSEREKVMWGWITGTALALPILLIIILTSK